MSHDTTMIRVSFTETREFRALVDFVAEVEEHADREDDHTLLSLVDALRENLMAGGMVD